MVTMDANSGVASVYANPPAIWIGSDHRPNGDCQQVGQRTDDDNRGSASGPVDVYRPSQRGLAEIETDLPQSVDSPDTAQEPRNCYCGCCPSCRMDAEIRRGQGLGETNDGQESDRQETANAVGPGELSESEQREVEELRRRDQEVRAHEQAHAAAGAHNVRYEYQSGPDGRQYAVGGSADIDIQTGSGDPDTRIAEAAKARAAAMAPADPSPKDMAVAARASRLEAEARSEKAQDEREARMGNDEDAHIDGNGPDAGAVRESSHFFALA